MSLPPATCQEDVLGLRDTMNGPVVTAAHKALEAENVNLILPYVPEDSAAEVKSAFEKVLQARKADLHFFETAARSIPGLGRGK